MIHWDREARRRKLSSRLKAFTPHLLLAFAGATAEHAKDVVLAGKVGKPVGPLLAEALRASWTAADSRAVDLGDLAARIEDAQPDEDDSSPPGHADLLDGASTLCSMIRKPTARLASGVASYAYQAVLARFIDRKASAGGEARFERAELATPQALAEIELQYAVLAALEALGPEPVTRDAVLAAVARGRGAAKR